MPAENFRLGPDRPDRPDRMARSARIARFDSLTVVRWDDVVALEPALAALGPW